MTAHTPLISVIVPVYNQEAYVAACIGSLRAQTMDDAEVIVVGPVEAASGDYEHVFGFEEAQGEFVVVLDPVALLVDLRDGVDFVDFAVETDAGESALAYVVDQVGLRFEQYFHRKNGRTG